MRRKWQKALSLVTAVALLGLAACSSSTDKPTTDPAKTEKIKIVYAHGKDETNASKKMIDDFNAKNPDIEVTELIMPAKSDAQHDDYATKLAGKDTSIDVFALDIIWPAEFGAAGWLEPLNKYFTKDELDKLLPGPVQGTNYKGEQIAIPHYTDAGVLYYRKDILEKAGKKPPKTFQELLDLSKELKGQEGTEFGFVFQANQYEGLVCDWLEYVWGNGGNVLDKDGKVIVNSPNTIEATKWMKEFVGVAPKGVTTYMEAESLNVFLEGKAVFHRNWPYAWAQSKSDVSKIKDKVGVVPMPVGPSGKEPAAALGGWNLGINKFIDQKKKDAAGKFLKYVVSADGQKITAIDGGRLPILQSMYKDADVLKANPHFAEFFDAMMAAKPRPVSPKYPQISDAIQRNIHKALSGTATPEDAVANIQKEVEALVK